MIAPNMAFWGLLLLFTPASAAEQPPVSAGILPVSRAWGGKGDPGIVETPAATSKAQVSVVADGEAKHEHVDMKKADTTQTVQRAVGEHDHEEAANAQPKAAHLEILRKEKDPTEEDEGASSGEPGDRHLIAPDPYGLRDMMKLADGMKSIANKVSSVSEWFEPSLPTKVRGSTFKKKEDSSTKKGTMDYITDIANSIIPTGGGGKSDSGNED